MKRRNREINIFNMSMLDVICSALGAILILFIVTLQAQNQAQAKAEDFEKKYQKLEQKVQTQQDQLNAKEQALAQTLQQLQQQAQQVKSQQAVIAKIAAANAKMQQQQGQQGQGQGKGTGMAIGMCEVNRAQVKISVFDHGTEDFDRIQIKLDKKMIARDITIRKTPAARNLALKPGVNYVNIKALNEGDFSPNTATMVIDPCNNGKPENFIWDMKTGEARNISIVRKQ